MSIWSGLLRIPNSCFVPTKRKASPAAVEECASLNFSAHSSQHTSTVLPPILTLIGFPSSLQSQAAHVVSITMSLSLNTRSPSPISRPRKKREPLSESLAIFSDLLEQD